MSISPNVPTPQESYTYETNAGTPRWIAVLFGVLILAVAGLAYAGHSAQSQLQTDLNKAQDQNKLLTAQLDHLLPRARGITANLCAQLDDGLMHLRLDPLFQNDFAAGNDLLNVRTQFARLWIDDLKFLLDAESEDVIFNCHAVDLFADFIQREIYCCADFRKLSGIT